MTDPRPRPYDERHVRTDGYTVVEQYAPCNCPNCEDPYHWFPIRGYPD